MRKQNNSLSEWFKEQVTKTIEDQKPAHKK
jgi:hypothetical protein